MAAITSGLNAPSIRRLKVTWQQVSQSYIDPLKACEMTIDANNNFTEYTSLMGSVAPPCVPFIGEWTPVSVIMCNINLRQGAFLSPLTIIQEEYPDNLPGGLINFHKHQMAYRVINEIERLQAQPFNFLVLPIISTYLANSLLNPTDSLRSEEHFWRLSLEREPKEHDEMMTKLLQESGFL